MSVIFLGIVTKVRDNWATFVPRAEHASNIVDPVKQKESREKRQAAQILRLATAPLAATITEFVASGENGTVIKHAADINGELGPALMDFLREHYPTGIPLRQEYNLTPANIFGIDIRNKLRIAAVEAFATGAKLPTSYWYHRAQSAEVASDPYELIIKSEHAEDISRQALCTFLGISCPTEELLTIDALAQAEVCRQLALKAGFV